jgi:hypothetical protein
MDRQFGLLMLALILSACSPESTAPLPALPTENDLPNGLNGSCACREENDCLVLEERPGRREVRNLNCGWLEPGGLAQCEFETRFIDQYYSATEAPHEVSGPWYSTTLVAKHLGNGLWCAERS